MSMVINLKSAITFRVPIGTRNCAFSTKTFRGIQLSLSKAKPDPKEQIRFRVTDIVIDSADPWFVLQEPVVLEIIWSNVLSVQHEKEA